MNNLLEDHQFYFKKYTNKNKNKKIIYHMDGYYSKEEFLKAINQQEKEIYIFDSLDFECFYYKEDLEHKIKIGVPVGNCFTVKDIELYLNMYNSKILPHKDIGLLILEKISTDISFFISGRIKTRKSGFLDDLESYNKANDNKYLFLEPSINISTKIKGNQEIQKYIIDNYIEFYFENDLKESTTTYTYQEALDRVEKENKYKNEFKIILEKIFINMRTNKNNKNKTNKSIKKRL